MTIRVHYEDYRGPQIYVISAITRKELELALTHFKNEHDLTDDQITIEMVTSI